MSYLIVKSIKVKDGKVYLNGASNNVFPHYYEEWESKSLTKILTEQGKEALDVEILEQYDAGNFQRGGSKYVRALQVLRHFPEYRAFDWRTNWDESQKTRGTAEYRALLLRALKTRLPKDRFIIAKQSDGRAIYLYTTRGRFARWTGTMDKAKIFRYKEDAEGLKKCYNGGEHWNVEPFKPSDGSASALGFKVGDFVMSPLFPAVIVGDVHTKTPMIEAWGVEHELGSAYAKELRKIEPGFFASYAKDQGYANGKRA